jgi:hypothetical protein
MRAHEVALPLSHFITHSASVVIISVRHDIVLNYICSSGPEFAALGPVGWQSTPSHPCQLKKLLEKLLPALIIAPSRINSRASVVLIKRSSLPPESVVARCIGARRAFYYQFTRARPPTLICLIGQVLIGQLAWEHNADQMRRRVLAREF